MEKPSPGRSKGKKFLRFLPKAASFSVPTPPYSPARDRANGHRGFSGPILIPVEARGGRVRGGAEAPEPTSPRVTCVGKVKSRKDACGTKRASAPGKEGRGSFGIGGCLFPRRARRGRGGGDDDMDDGGVSPTVTAAASRAPPLGQLRRFACGREGLRGFQWGDPVVAEEKGEGHVERDMGDEDGEEEEEEEEVAMPESADVVVVGAVALEPRKEVNIWKRRTVAPLPPLQV